MISKVKSRGFLRVAAIVLLALGLGLGTLTACSGRGATATCDDDKSCTITFDRQKNHAQIDVLGVSVRLISSSDSSATLAIGDRQVTVNKGQTVKVGNLAVTVEQITSTQVIVKVART